MRRRERRNDVQVKGGGKMGHKRKRFSLSLSALTVICVTVASLAAVSSCIAIFASVYSRSLMRDAKSEFGADRTADGDRGEQQSRSYEKQAYCGQKYSV